MPITPDEFNASFTQGLAANLTQMQKNAEDKKRVQPIFITYNTNGYNGTTAYLTFGNDSRDFTRGRIQLKDGCTVPEAVAILRELADQLESDTGPMIRHKEELFED
jgi:hypothetical protein